VLQESRTHNRCSVKHFGPQQPPDALPATLSPRALWWSSLRRSRAEHCETRICCLTRTLTVTDSARKVVDFRRFSAPRSTLGERCPRRPRREHPRRATWSGSRASRPGRRSARNVETTLRAVGGSPEQIRTAVSALRGRRPRPLDDGAVGLGGEDSNPQRQGQNLLCCRLHHPRRCGQPSGSTSRRRRRGGSSAGSGASVSARGGLGLGGRGGGRGHVRGAGSSRRAAVPRGGPRSRRTPPASSCGR
jgi:hypothetical protein